METVNEVKYEAFILFRDYLRDYWISAGLNEILANLLNLLILTIAVIILGWLLKFLTQKIFINFLERIIRKSKTTYDDYIIERKVLHRAAHLVPALVIYSMSDVVFQGHETLMEFVVDCSQLYILFVFLWTIAASIKVLEDIYNAMPNSAERPIKGYIQVAHIIIWFIGSLVAVSILADTDLTKVFASLGAVAAVLLLIFKDTILGLVAGIQLSANKMIKIGDWISMPSHNADGTVVEITLNTVKVLNGDKTIASIPTYNLVSGSFLNYKGLEETGARRIKRSINIDVSTVKFLSGEKISRLRNITLLRDFFQEYDNELQTLTTESTDALVILEEKKLTNLGIFMKYMESFLKNHPKLRKDMTIVVRQLQPTENGIPVEIYAYSAEVALPLYESLQASIFNHVFAIVDEFDLRLFQRPSGYDYSRSKE
jgi:miniconductance mechanosensitive channel